MQLIIQICEPCGIFEPDDLMKIKGLEVIVDAGPLPPGYHGLVMRCDRDGVSLALADSPDTTPTRVDFANARLHHRLRTSRRSEGLPKAVGLDRQALPLTVLDATAGLGSDAFILAGMGCEVVMVERSPVMAALLAAGLAQGSTLADASLRAILDRLSLHRGDAHAYLDTVGHQGRQPDVVYLDPMFPERRKSAKVKKDMALMQQFLPVNDDVDSLLEKAREVANKRVVLKRPGKAQKQPFPKPDFQVPGKACHFQVFLTGHRAASGGSGQQGPHDV